VLPQGAKDLHNFLQMLHPSLDKGDDVIQIYDHKRVSEKSQDIIHHPHECRLRNS
jgi:hypothetical protein